MVYVFGVFLILHGLIHAGYFAPALPVPPQAKIKPPEFSFEHSWLIKYLGIHAGTVKFTGTGAVVVALVGFIAAGLGVMGVPWLANYWQTVAIVSAAASTLVLLASWNAWFIAALAINIAIAAYAFLAQ